MDAEAGASFGAFDLLVLALNSCLLHFLPRKKSVAKLLLSFAKPNMRVRVSRKFGRGVTKQTRRADM